MSDSSVIVFGYGELGLAAVDALSAAGARVLAVVVPSNRSGPDIDRISAHASERGLLVLIQPPARSNAAFVDRLKTASPDTILVWSYSMILPQAVLDVPERGAVNVHGGLLPQYRGGHVMQWAIINGEAETGVTLHYMDAGIDTGPIIGEARFPIEADADAMSVKSKLKTAGSELIGRWWPQIADGTAPRRVQDETRARFWPMRTPEDGRIDWSQSNVQICRLVRALVCNVPGAFIEVNGKHVSVTKAEPLPSGEDRRNPGSIMESNGRGLRVSTGDGDVVIKEILVDGRRIAGKDLAEVVPRG